uniref:Uncharacterized protein n=1 Tax=Onchocerca volvulus TaxID=6282 RepID=A0A8R1TUU0_ONCVO
MIVENSNIEHECNLLNRHELSRSQKYELQRFIDQNSHLLRSPSSQGTGDSSTWAKDKEGERSNAYQHSDGTLSALSVSPNRGRKEVKWSDDVSQLAPTIRRTSSLSPNWSTPSNHLKNSNSFDDFYNLYNSYNSNKNKNNNSYDSNKNTSDNRNNNDNINTMSSYGSTGYMNRGRDNQFSTNSPTNNYQSYGKHPDDYNRYETARSRSHASQRQREEDERSRFFGYGDRPGSGVEFMPTKWHGGEASIFKIITIRKKIITDPGHLPRSLKPRRLYYSPIGDGVVAADGVELKRVPKDLSPKITVIHNRTLDRGEPGHAGYNIYTRTMTHESLNLGNDGSDMGGSGRDSRLTGGISPGSDLYGQQSGTSPGMSYGGREPDYKGGAGGTGEQRPGSGGGYATRSGGGNTPFGHGKDYSSDAGSGGTGYPGGRSFYTNSTRGQGVPKGYDIESPKPGVDGYGTGMRGVDSYGSGPRGSDLYGTKSPNYRYHSPTSTYPYSSAYHDLHNTHGFTQSDPFLSASRGRSQSVDLLNGPDNYGDYGFKNNGRLSDGPTVHESVKTERYHKFDVTKDYLITNPRELIHQYATTTPISILEIPETSSRTVKKMYSSTTEEKYVPYPPYKGSSAAVHPNNFARQIRNEGLTESQREANRHQNPLTSDSPEVTQKISEIRRETSRTAPTNKEIDNLTEKMMSNLQSGQAIPLHY